MFPAALTLVDAQLEAAVADQYKNIPLSLVNDHVVRLSVMTEPFYWHQHPNSDETFFVLEGTLCIELADRTVELTPGQLFTVPATVVHRTRPQGSRSVNLSFERADLQTVRTE